MADDEGEGYAVRWTGLDIDGRYEVTGPVEPPPTMFFNMNLKPAPWTTRTWTLRGAKRAIRNHKRSKKIIYREAT